MKIRFVWLGVVAMAAACGDGVLFSEGDSGAGAGDASSSTSDAVVGSQSSADASSSSASSTSGGGGMGTGGSGSGGDGGSGGEPPTLAVLECGDESCPIEPQSACCWDSQENYGMPYATCVKGSVANDDCQTPEDGSGTETRIECQTSDQCGPGALCCGERVGNQQLTIYARTSCEQTCNYPDIVLCSTPNINDVCPMIPTQNGMVQSVCKQSSLLPTGYYVCGTP